MCYTGTCSHEDWHTGECKHPGKGCIVEQEQRWLSSQKEEEATENDQAT